VGRGDEQDRCTTPFHPPLGGIRRRACHSPISMRPAILLVLVLIPFFGAGHSSLSVWAATPNAMVLTLSDLGAKGSLGRRVSGTSAPGHPGIEVTMIVHLGMKTILSSFFVAGHSSLSAWTVIPIATGASPFRLSVRVVVLV